MNGLTRNLLILTVLTGLGITYFQVTKEDPAQETTSDTTVEVNTPDIFGREVQFNQLREDGSLHYRLKADSIRQFLDENLTRMEVPEVHLRNPDQPPWDIYAQEGFIRKLEQSAQDVVFLRSAVRMVQDHPVNGQITLRSESFYLYPDRQYAQTEDDVIIDTEVGRTTAAGMSANLDTGVLTLTSSTTQRIHTIVLPEQFKKT